MVFIWIGNLFSFESIYCAGKKERWTDEGSGGRERAPIGPDKRNTGRRCRVLLDFCSSKVLD